MLTDEGLKDKEMRFNTKDHETWVLENGSQVMGFFTITPLRKIWYLQHFCIGRMYRTVKRARFLGKAVKAVMFGKKCSVFVIDIPKSKPELAKIIHYFFKAREYGNDRKNQHFVVSLVGG